MKNLTSFLAALTLGAVAISQTGCRTATAAEKGFAPLFDGKTLAGWQGLPDHWRVQDGAITGYTEKLNPLKNNTFLVWTNGTVDNFELHFRYRMIGGNSGVQYRSKLMDPEKFIVGGYQADFEAGKTYSGILYEERGRGILAERGQRTHIIEENGQTKVVKTGDLAPSAELQANIHDEDWNDYVIIADGNHLMHFINNRMTVEVVDDQPSKAAKSGILALQIHVGPPMIVQFKDLRIKKLP
jgi:hypothetical protein